jgi:hypothetical protein
MTDPAKPDLESIIGDAFVLLETWRRGGGTGDYWDALRAAVTAAVTAVPEPHRQLITPLPLVENVAAHLYVALAPQPASALEELRRAIAGAYRGH